MTCMSDVGTLDVAMQVDAAVGGDIGMETLSHNLTRTPLKCEDEMMARYTPKPPGYLVDKSTRLRPTMEAS